jgi:hypothetical protein
MDLIHWIKPNSGLSGTILGSFGWGYYINTTANNNINLNYLNTSSNWTSCFSNSILIENSWHMVTITKSGSTITFYINNVLDNVNISMPNIKVYSQINSWFGANGQDNNGYLNCIIDDIGIWNRALNQQEIFYL